MNSPLQVSLVGSRVRWWDARGALKHGKVKAIHFLTDTSQVVEIQVEDGQPSIVTLPMERLTRLYLVDGWAQFHCKMMGGNSSSVRMTRGGAARGRSDVKKYILRPTGWGDRDGKFG
ncbi:hypothetical protein BGY98DRAFT_932073 [Russula aff. rugulosa BPL654]|nr:hypothetical protein BGY98DRAFT_932073 [Russula aff. rugulosa BPL654]